MKLRGIDFGHVMNSSGARNFDGSGWWYHHVLGLVGLNYKGSTFVAKTTTLGARAGNMPLNGISPIERKPSCIKVYPQKGVVLNAVGLSGPGAEALLQQGFWQKQTKPFFISFMSVAPKRLERLGELMAFVDLLRTYLPFPAPVGLQINFSCPNIGLDPRELVAEMQEALDAASVLDIPLVPKINVMFDPQDIVDIADHPAFDALCVSNTIPWAKIPKPMQIELFETTTSPLAKFGGGGLSGKPLLPLVVAWIRDLRAGGFLKPIVGGGGILSADDADQMLDAGADAVELGSVSMLRPWRVRGIIRHVNERMGL